MIIIMVILQVNTIIKFLMYKFINFKINNIFEYTNLHLNYSL